MHFDGAARSYAAAGTVMSDRETERDRERKERANSHTTEGYPNRWRITSARGSRTLHVIKVSQSTDYAGQSRECVVVNEFGVDLSTRENVATFTQPVTNWKLDISKIEFPKYERSTIQPSFLIEI